MTPKGHIAPWDIPSVDNSAMDGFAFSHASVSDKRLQVTDFLAAGDVHTVAVPSAEAAKIMTGAPIPPGCDTVVLIEDFVEGDQSFLHTTQSATNKGKRPHLVGCIVSLDNDR